MQRFRLHQVLALVAAFSWHTAFAIQPDAASANKIVGKIVVDYTSRNGGDSDNYAIDLNVANRVLFEGTSVRAIQGGRPLVYEYNVQVRAVNPNNIAQVVKAGDILGGMAVDTTNAYVFNSNRNVRVSKPLQYNPQMRYEGDINFTNGYQGKAPKAGGLSGSIRDFLGRTANKVGLVEITRQIGQRTIKLTLTDPDPVSFKNTQLAGGPISGKYPAAIVNGQMIFGYTGKKNGAWALQNLTVQSGNATDKLTGSIRYEEKASTSKTNDGKTVNCTGSYDVNVRYNEESNSASIKEDDFFKQTGTKPENEEDAFFAKDDVTSSITGKICIADSGTVSKKVDGKDVDEPTHSDIHFDLSLNKVTDTQAVAFTKLVMITLGPLFDE